MALWEHPSCLFLNNRGGAPRGNVQRFEQPDDGYKWERHQRPEDSLGNLVPLMQNNSAKLVSVQNPKQKARFRLALMYLRRLRPGGLMVLAPVCCLASHTYFGNHQSHILGSRAYVKGWRKCKPDWAHAVQHLEGLAWVAFNCFRLKPQ